MPVLTGGPPYVYSVQSQCYAIYMYLHGGEVDMDEPGGRTTNHNYCGHGWVGWFGVLGLTPQQQPGSYQRV